jgi:tetratricopeptide (TPR) repeat protein/O-antigen ligase
VWAPLASGAYRGWPQALAFLLVAAAAAAWLVGSLLERELAWRRSALDLPLVLLLALVLLQIAVGNRALVTWALGAARPVTDVAADFPAPFLTIGSVTPHQTLSSGLVFAGYAAVYALVVQLVRTRRQVSFIVSLLLTVGGVMAFLGLLDYLTGETWLLAWRDHPFTGRLSGTFVNPDHFGAWLTMLMALGLGWLVARTSSRRRAPSLAARLTVRELREHAVRRYLPLIGVVVMGVALVFTLSRGALVGLVAALLAFIALLSVTGRARRSLVVTAALLIAIIAYGGWIGFGPWVARLTQTPVGSIDRLTQYLASLPLLREFPILGVGLGGYRDIYFRHQPVAHHPERFYFPYAHNDLLQLVLELGVVGTVLCVFFAWRLAADLIGAHVLGRGACPVDGGEGPEAMRSDRFSVGIAVGALAGAAGLIAHSALDFSARIPAVGFLAAALLGLATVTLHTRMQPDHEQLLSGVRVLALTRPLRAAAVGTLALVLLGGWTWAWIHGTRVRAAEQALLTGPPGEGLARANDVLAIDRGSVPALRRRARARTDSAVATWRSTPVAGVDRDRAARDLLALARADLRAAIVLMPTYPDLHLDLGWVEATDALIQRRSGPEGLAPALTHGARAVALGADSPVFYAGMARLAYSVPELSMKAAREAVRRDPALLVEMVDLYAPMGLTETEWLTIVPERAVDRLELAMVLGARGRRAESLAAYRAAVAVAPSSEIVVYRWALADALARMGAVDDALLVLREAVAADPSNAELQRALGVALARRNDPEALDHLRRAVSVTERLGEAEERRPFVVSDPRLAGLIQRIARDLDRPERYRRALAAYLTERSLWDQALVEWRVLVRDDPKNGEARFGIGRAREGAGALDEALEDYRAAVALEPNATRYRRRLADRLWQSEQYFQAINEWQIVKSQAPDDVESRLALARALEKVGQPVEAYREYREVLTRAPGQSEAARAVARLEGRRH